MSYEITSLEALAEIYAAPIPNVMKKETAALTPEYRAWLERSNFFAFASVNADQIDCSPRGDAHGEAFAVLSDTELAIPDRRGNNRLDTLRNIIQDPRVSLLFLIPGINETLRIKGKARITTDPALTARFDMNGKQPVSVILIEIEAVYFQCARALKRANLWAEESKQTKDTVPSAGKMIEGAIKGFDGQEYDDALQERQAKTLY